MAAQTPCKEMQLTNHGMYQEVILACMLLELGQVLRNSEVVKLQRLVAHCLHDNIAIAQFAAHNGVSTHRSTSRETLSSNASSHAHIYGVKPIHIELGSRVN